MGAAGDAAAGIALINSVGNVGGFVRPYAIGYIRDATGSNYGGMLVLSDLILLAGLLALAVRRDRRLEEVATTARTPASG